jgi:hypothetical protein
MDMASRTSAAMGIAIVAGLLLIISGLSGLATWETIKEFVAEHISDNSAVHTIFAILIFIASLGGIAVIAGGILIGRNRVGTGKLVIALGAGLGLIGLIISLVIAYTENSLTLGEYFSVGFIGLILSIIARGMAKKET